MKEKSIPHINLCNLCGGSMVHFIGIGGIGMSALARYFLAIKAPVSGSDTSASEITAELAKEGARVKIGHKTSNITPKIGLIIHSAAIPPENPEIQKARKLGIPIKSYSEAIGELTKKYKTIAVSGSHGKSTTTALLSLVLKNTRFNPTVIIGTKLKEFNGRNFRKGRSDYLVLEADEYQKSFLHYSPIAAIITNIDREHLDVFKNLNEIKKIFLKFINNTRQGGILVVNKDDKNLFDLRNQINDIAKKKNLKVFWYSIALYKRSLVKCYIQKILKIPGRHNLSNALAVYTLAKAVGVNQKKIFNAIGNYRGAWRRMEYRGKFQIPNSKFQIPVYDDYAHHPTEIRATLSAFRQKCPKSKIICVFQPHQAQRLAALFKEFTRAFDNADVLILLDIFKVKGRDKVSQNINSKKLAEVINKRLSKSKNIKFKKILYLLYSKQRQLRKIIEDLIIRNSYHSHLFVDSHYIIVMMGAGDIYKYTDFLVK